MRPGMKMLMISGMDQSRNNEYDMDSRYRDGRGREHYESGRYAPRNEYTERNYPVRKEMRMDTDDMESRRRRDSKGRFRSEWDDMEDNYGNEARTGGYPNRPFPVYEGGKSNMNPIGFDPYREVETNYRMNATHKTGNEMERRYSPKMGGGYSSDMSMPMTKEMAEEWTKNMRNEDGSKGPHWKIDQIKQVMTQKGVQYDPWEFFAIMNALYSDYCSVFKKHGVNTVDMYFDLACAWLNDTDAMPNKAALYYENIVKK